MQTFVASVVEGQERTVGWARRARGEWGARADWRSSSSRHPPSRKFLGTGGKRESTRFAAEIKGGGTLNFSGTELIPNIQGPPDLIKSPWDKGQNMVGHRSLKSHDLANRQLCILKCVSSCDRLISRQRTVLTMTTQKAWIVTEKPETICIVDLYDAC